MNTIATQDRFYSFQASGLGYVFDRLENGMVRNMDGTAFTGTKVACRKMAKSLNANWNNR